MSVHDHPGESPGAVGCEDSSRPVAVASFTVAVTDDAQRATITVHLEPPEGERDPTRRADELAQARAALTRARVTHGVDERALAGAVAAADGLPRPVASATAPGEPVHGAVVLLHARELARDPLFTVPAGSPIAQRTPAREGTPGTDVTGGPIPPRTAVVVDLEAGDGARIEDMGDGRLVARSTVDGRPKLASGRIGVDAVVRAREISTATELVVHGTLVVQGDVGEGSRISASDQVVIGGMVARSSIAAERGVTVNGACLGSHLVVGARQAACRRVRDALRGPHRELCDLEAALGQLLAGSATAGGVGTQRAALGLLVQRRFPQLAAAWAAVVEPLEADAHAAGVPGERVAQAQRLAAALRPDARDDAPDRHELLTLRARFGEELARLDAIPDEGADVRLGHAQACRVEATGSLTITGPGTYNTDVVVDGDMSVESAGATVRGGTISVGGRLCVGEIGAPGGARVTVTLAGPAGRTVRMEAGIAHPGVEVRLAGRPVSIERTTLNFALGCDDNNRVVRSGEIAD